MRKLFFLILFFRGIAVVAQLPAAAPASKILHEMEKLKVLGSVLYLAAHPDDENTRLITWLANEKKYRTAYLSLTRGDGGQNLIGDEQAVELGLIRTQELLAARRIDGGEQFFTRAYDFGYSKKPEETFRIWEKDSILADVVWVIRRFQPDVIITRFPVTGEGGHGHHSASAILANEAFQAAGDPTRFPEQLKYVTVWQAKRILWNTFNFGGTNTTAPDQLKIDVGGFNPLLGKSYGEIAAESRSQHKSQGFGVPSTRGESFEYFKTTGGAAPRTDLFDDLQSDWSRLPQSVGLAQQLDSLTAQFNVQYPERSLERLLQIHARISALPPSGWKEYKLNALRNIIFQCAGLYAEAITAQPTVAHGDTLRFSLNLIARRDFPVQLHSLWYSDRDTTLHHALPSNRTYSLPAAIPVKQSWGITQPYWLQAPMQAGRFTVVDPLQVGLPENPAPVRVRVGFRMGNTDLSLEIPVVHKFTDPVRGEVFKPLVVRPTVELDAVQELTFISGSKAKGDLSFRLQANQSLEASSIRAIQSGNATELESIPATEKGKSLTRTQSLPLQPGTYSFALFSAADRKISQAGRLTRIEYDHVPEIHYFRAVPQRVVSIDLKTLGKRVGYIEGAGDKVAEALETMGYEVVRLGEKELSRNDLSSFDAIVTGVRAYNTHVWLNDAYGRLMRYVEQGGNLIVQYNTSSQIGPVRAQIGPYPFNIIRSRITDETAAVTFLDPTHPVFNRPNKLLAGDFENWIQERSVYHGADTSGRMLRLLSMTDPGEKPEEGALLIARYGKGWFTYTGLALFRQLPAGVPGAYRLLANLIALNARAKE